MQWQYSSAGSARPALIRIILTAALAIAGVAAAEAYRDPVDPTAVPATAAAVADATGVPSGIPLRDPVPGEFDRQIRGAIDDALKLPEPPQPAPSPWRAIAVRNGENLSQLFGDLGLPATDCAAVMQLGGDAAQLRHLRVGDVLNLRIENQRLAELTYALDEARTLDVRRGAGGLSATTLTSAIEHRSVATSGSIQDSLFVDGRRANLSDRMIMQFADVFGYDIDFAQDLQQGDRFAVVYDQIYKNGRKLRDGDILAAEFINQGHIFKAVRHVDAGGHAAYYSADGHCLKKAFIRTPVDYARISSGFSLNRMHPILHRMRAHQGVDYAAPIGTPVKATGDGRVEFAGRKGGYGNFIVIRHWGPYETAYGHLSRFKPGIHAGTQVHMGEVIAYVGMTGLATGPHLHYEFRVNGVHVNPVTVPLPRAEMIQGTQALASFRTETEPLLAQLDSAVNNRLASASPPVQKN